MLSACMGTAPARLDTQSGRPEVDIPGVSKKQAVDAIITREMEKGWDLKTQTDSMLVFGKRINNLGAALLFGSQYDRTPEGRLRFTLVETESGVKIYVKIEMITNPGSAYERVTEGTSAEDLEKGQYALEEIKADLENKKSKPTANQKAE